MLAPSSVTHGSPLAYLYLSSSSHCLRLWRQLRAAGATQQHIVSLGGMKAVKQHKRISGMKVTLS